MTFSNEEKWRCLMREIAMRKKIYPRRIELGKMSKEKADLEIAIIEAIANDYVNRQ
jgi:hypothetical protein